MRSLKSLLVGTAAMMMDADCNPFMRVPNRPQGSVKLSNRSIALFTEQQRELKEFKIKGHKVMAYSRKDAITRLKHQKKI